MKKILLTSVICMSLTLFAITAGFGGFAEIGSDFKKAACERSCEEVYNKCMEAAGKAVDREGQGDFEGDIKYEAKRASCEDRKNACLEKC